LHRQASAAASLAGQSLNAWLTDQIRSGVAGGPTTAGIVARPSAGRKQSTSGGRQSPSATKKRATRRRQRA
jgi:hypothetical protein